MEPNEERQGNDKKAERLAKRRERRQGAIKHGRGNALINDRATCDAH